MNKSLTLVAVTAIVLALSFGFINPFSSFTTEKKAPVVTTKPLNPDQEWVSLYDSLQLQSLGLSSEAFHYAWHGFQQMKLEHPVVAIADFSQSSRNKRLYVIDLLKKKLIYNTYVAHGMNSGQEFAQRFSNNDSSHQSSLGFYKTMGTYQGKHGLSLKLEGLEKGINDHVYSRAIVMHGADYVSEAFIKQTGRLGRSQGCPAVSYADHKILINLLKGGAGLFLYSNNADYLKQSQLLTGVHQTDQRAEIASDLSHPYTSL
ncbi:hypothetical protein BWI93_00570 [Siphonobacter sp. BAB-5385]|uniref:murein L,D-transpeptidase catalytic domain family protein n=1 Tax=unclassified Siphonobacter TaxID=2635712 RepID=UPI000B9EA141|nr:MULTISPECIES: murein L,D-transpeptidase catalytic domain family protein [unclassified Siphonobacter]OZI10052.1 hypothetical protein BWI93_00570 [Siphonobacter sp. BAB-5385]PMD96251.1 hypothetical protein BWI97_13280 [Siphonobacter sp. BAB-5405]